ncbi:uncharacterized protein MONBRDRAFT_30893 [Monosiga brevicollis MX1]|uniref:Claudin n=1 Tax=Monosiga brevicollis TaxID=81824 RepID=A9UQ05_MONBE|nr:uncharacterized protein MONBRDRAFT_30893 [Monosiga brevicollis MX1]EDQ92964.1 predicted protein [Monosiga brevicollis MX1]|eukprot:XP_001742726.1 hypothetical protein [Monosiga brevicollis MX1]
MALYHSLSLGVHAFGILCLVLAIALNSWSTGTATENDVSGDVRFGLWRACADVSGEYVFSLNPSGSDCRIGHCIENPYLSEDGDKDSHKLCTNSKAIAGLLLISLCFFLMSVKTSNINHARGQTPHYGWSSALMFLSAILILGAWATWVSWQSKVNDDDGSNPNAVVFFGKLNLGAGFAFALLAWICALVLLLIQCMLLREYDAAQVENTMNRGRQSIGQRLTAGSINSTSVDDTPLPEEDSATATQA